MQPSVELIEDGTRGVLLEVLKPKIATRFNAGHQ